MNRRDLFKTLGVGAATLCGGRALLCANPERVTTLKAKALGMSHWTKPATFRGKPLVWDDGKPSSLVDTGHGLAQIEFQPVLFVGGPLHGEILEWREYEFCKIAGIHSKAFFTYGGLLRVLDYTNDAKVKYRRVRDYAMLDSMPDNMTREVHARHAQNIAKHNSPELYRKWYYADLLSGLDGK